MQGLSRVAYMIQTREAREGVRKEVGGATGRYIDYRINKDRVFCRGSPTREETLKRMKCWQ